MAYEQELGQDLGSAVVGADRASLLVKGQTTFSESRLAKPVGGRRIRRSAAVGLLLQESGGGFGQYYKGPLRELGVLHEHSAATCPMFNCRLCRQKESPQTLDQKKAFEELKGLAIEGRATNR